MEEVLAGQRSTTEELHQGPLVQNSKRTLDLSYKVVTEGFPTVPFPCKEHRPRRRLGPVLRTALPSLNTLDPLTMKSGASPTDHRQAWV